MSHDSSYLIGNTQEDGAQHRGWFIGHFVEESDIRHSNDVEIKWDHANKGTQRTEWSVNKTAHTMSLIISGSFKIIFEDDEFVLGAGEYFLSKPTIPHKYEVLEDSLILTVRWPSLTNDHTNKE